MVLLRVPEQGNVPSISLVVSQRCCETRVQWRGSAVSSISSLSISVLHVGSFHFLPLFSVNCGTFSFCGAKCLPSVPHNEGFTLRAGAVVPNNWQSGLVTFILFSIFQYFS